MPRRAMSSWLRRKDTSARIGVASYTCSAWLGATPFALWPAAHVDLTILARLAIAIVAAA